MKLLVLILLFSVILCSCASAIEDNLRYSGILAASEFIPGENRVPFGLVSMNGDFLENADVVVKIAKLEDEGWKVTDEKKPEWHVIKGITPHKHPDGEVHLHLDFQGIYILKDVHFDSAGIWSLNFSIADGTPTEEAVFRVKETGSAPKVGEAAIPIRNLTISQVDNFNEISSRAVLQDGMHDYSVADALELNEPFVVFFASPQFCITALCGPVTDTLEAAKIALDDRVIFIHIEPWDLTVARNEGKLVKSRAMEQWRLPSEPWTFIVDHQGVITERFEGIVTENEILDSVNRLLDSNTNKTSN